MRTATPEEIAALELLAVELEIASVVSVASDILGGEGDDEAHLINLHEAFTDRRLGHRVVARREQAIGVVVDRLQDARVAPAERPRYATHRWKCGSSHPLEVTVDRRV
jgi:hypothetical protein